MKRDEVIETVAKAICTGPKTNIYDDSKPVAEDCTCSTDGGTCFAMDMYGEEARSAVAAMLAERSKGND